MSRSYIWPALVAAIFTAIIFNTGLEMDDNRPATTLNTTYGATTHHPMAEHPWVRLGGEVVYVEIADDPVERGRGLSGRGRLSDGWGMIFIFEKPGRYSFWMYGMLFPLDIIWIDENGVVVYIVENAQPCDGVCESYVPDIDALYVLEVRAGFAEDAGIAKGDLVEISLPTQPSPAQ